MWSWVVCMISLGLSAADPMGITSAMLTPTAPMLTITGQTDNWISGEIRFEKAYAEFTDKMNGYGVFLARDCNGYLTFLEAQTEDQNPYQGVAEGYIQQKESFDNFNARSLNISIPYWENVNWTIPESWIPIGWREKIHSVLVPQHTDNALQISAVVAPMLEFMKYPDTQLYKSTFNNYLPKLANALVLYGGMYIKDPNHQQQVRLGTIPDNVPPKDVFVPLSDPVIMPIKRYGDEALYLTPLDPRFYGYVENMTLNGVATFSGAFYENAIPGYYVLLGSGPDAPDRIGTEFSYVRGVLPLPRRPDGRYEVHFINVNLDSSVSHILIFGGHPHNCNKPAAIALFPSPSPSPEIDVIVIPDESTPEDVNFITSGPDKLGNLTGILLFKPAQNDDNFLGYAIQWAAKMTQSSRVPIYGGDPMQDFTIDVLWKDVLATATYSITFPELIVPRHASYLRISGFSQFNPNVPLGHAAEVVGTPAFVPLTGGRGSN